jgi:hypothetical protein
MAETRLEWGHKVFDPDGNPIQLPAKAITLLRRLGCLRKNRFLGGHQISPAIRQLLTPEYNAITGSLRQVLGTDLQGPTELVCHCQQCKRKLNEMLAALQDNLIDFQDFMAQQSST